MTITIDLSNEPTMDAAIDKAAASVIAAFPALELS